MLNFNDKPIEELDFNECIEFEKSFLKKVLNASRAGMSDAIIEQLNFYLSLVRQYKREAAQREIDDLRKDEGRGDDGVSVDLGIDE